jgi:hypothetical protein
MIHGMKGRELFKEEEMLISIPYQWIPIMAQNLQKMKVHLPPTTVRKNIWKNLDR